jgi:hypothetical protein
MILIKDRKKKIDNSIKLKNWKLPKSSMSSYDFFAKMALIVFWKQ